MWSGMDLRLHRIVCVQSESHEQLSAGCLLRYLDRRSFAVVHVLTCSTSCDQARPAQALKAVHQCARNLPMQLPSYPFYIFGADSNLLVTCVHSMHSMPSHGGVCRSSWELVSTSMKRRCSAAYKSHSCPLACLHTATSCKKSSTTAGAQHSGHSLDPERHC